jgi:ribosomal protein L11 methyltransferase
MDYVELNIRCADTEQAEIVTAELAELPFESFQTDGELLKAYIPRERLADCMAEADELLARYGIADRRYIAIEPQNWNALWEQSFTPVEVDGKLLIRAPFHDPRPAFGLEVIVMPRMAFGSGHHATTCLMASALYDLPTGGKRGLDMGCGTGVLASVAAKRGATAVDAVDIDEWAEANCRENVAANGLDGIIVPLLGDIRRIAGRKYDFIAANINRNILLMDMPAYADVLTAGGDLLMSGFLEEDIPIIAAKAETCGLMAVETRLRDGWAMVHVKKSVGNV